MTESRHRTIVSVVGARPNFIKLAPVARVLRQRADVRHVVVHTGQHYDLNMSATFFEDLDIGAPDHNLEVGSAPHGRQTGAIMQRLEPLLETLEPRVVLVYGDVNSTVAAALVAVKLGISVGHVEAGLRSFDWTMPEEINRVVTDRLADLLFTPSRDADHNLRAEGIPTERIHFVGNIMIDALQHAVPQARRVGAWLRQGVRPGEYVVATLHRPSNVDRPDTLRALLEALAAIAQDHPVLFPVHPRTGQRIQQLSPAPNGHGDLRLIDPVGYIDMLSLVLSAGLVVTDSGGLQEETTFLGIPCLTVRPNTERPITVIEGTNRLVGPDPATIVDAAHEALVARGPRAVRIERWDGQTAERIVQVLCDGAAFR